MSQNAKRLSEQGTGLYQLSRSDAGEVYRAAKRVKLHETTYWNRKKNRQKGNK